MTAGADVDGDGEHWSGTWDSMLDTVVTLLATGDDELCDVEEDEEVMFDDEHDGSSSSEADPGKFQINFLH